MFRTQASFVGAALALLFLLSPAVSAAPKRYYIGAPWEDGVERGVDQQRALMRRGTTPKSIVERAARSARRDNSVVNLYLLARAYGLRANVAQARAEKLSDPAARRHQEQAAQTDFSEAMGIYREVLRKAPTCYFAWHDMGVLELQRNPKATRLAYDHFTKAYRINPKYTPTQRQIVRLFLAGKQYENAIPVIQRVLELDPGDEDARLRLVTCYGAIKKYDMAYAILDPMVAKTPNDLRLLAMRSHLDNKTKRYLRAVTTYRRLARANPNVPTAFLGLLEALQDPKTREQIPTALEDYLFALKGLRRLERDPENIKRIDEDIAKMEHRMANPDADTTGGPPSTEQLLHALRGPDAKRRAQAVLYLMVREEKATNEVVRAIAGHLSPAAESDAAVRYNVVRALGFMSGTRLLPLIRLGLADPDMRVRVQTADTLAGLAARDPEALGPVISILGLYVEAENPELSAAARNGILSLARINLPGLDEESTDAEYRAAFREWWSGTEGSDLLIRSLELYHKARDRRPDQVLVPYLDAQDFYVFRGAYNGLQAAAKHAGGEAIVRWFASMPVIPAERLKKAEHAALKSQLDAWVARRPGS